MIESKEPIMRRAFREEQGFTLIEVMAALVILAIVSLGLMAYFGDSLSFSKSNENKTVMVNLARSALVYAEKQDFEKWKKYLEENKTVQAGLCKTADSCGAYTLLVNDTSTLSYILNPVINGITYQVSIQSQLQSGGKGVTEEGSVYLMPVQVRVQGPEIESRQEDTVVEGYITDEKIR
ncbi:type IV pilus modification PilV family protein [Paenibacillus shenyangensis]|uniref:type IV pilus modification PilV family protein n=1 Tax=Paenibacillus sp. A9 TaxID=1284352 RepID=UPI001EE73401|nr:prepilin-type N-terminal cleavage/methylation domain-containing protein [Paenibacillus sp. A9]